MTPERYEQISRIFGEATEQPPGKRIEYVEQACGNDTELNREVLSLLKHHEEPPKEPDVLKRIEVRRSRIPRIGIRWRRSEQGGRKRLTLFAVLSAVDYFVKFSRRLGLAGRPAH